MQLHQSISHGVSGIDFSASLSRAVQNFRDPVKILKLKDGQLVVAPSSGSVEDSEIYALIPSIYPEWLGDRSFCAIHNVRFPYVTGAMANGIASADLVIAMAKANMLGFFGSGGLSYARVEKEIERISEELAGTSFTWGANLIHSPSEPQLEERVVDLYLAKGVRRISAAAYMKVMPSVARYAIKGLSQDSTGKIFRKNHVFAKISRAETASGFMKPVPPQMVADLLAAGKITEDEARLAALVPLAEDITVESDSGGHTDNRPLGSLFPTIVHARNEIVAEYSYSRPIRLGAAGGLGSPTSLASAFALGASYVLTGSVNQGAVESGMSTYGKELLAKADVTDVAMAPAADMFELGVELQVLKRGTMFSQRAKWLWELYKKYNSLDEIPDSDKGRLEKQIFRNSIETIRDETLSFWEGRNPDEAAKARKNPRHLMALMFRWYLGLGSRWAIIGEDTRKIDYQIWCGPAMGAFNSWVKGSFLEPPENRNAVQIALNLLEGACTLTRAHQLRSFGIEVPSSLLNFKPRLLK